MGSKIKGWDLGVNQARAPQFHGIQRRSESESADLRSVPFSLQICAYLTISLSHFHIFAVICKYQEWRIQNYAIRDLKYLFVCQGMINFYLLTFPICWHTNPEENGTGFYFCQYFKFWLQLQTSQSWYAEFVATYLGWRVQRELILVLPNYFLPLSWFGYLGKHCIAFI